MTVKLVRKLFSYVGIDQLTEEDIASFIRFSKLDRLPPHMIVIVSTCLPLLEIALRRALNEQIDWGDLEDADRK
jgi:hypothetical protein